MNKSKLFEKCYEVIRSCKTKDQVRLAERYCELAEEHLDPLQIGALSTISISHFCELEGFNRQ